MNEYGLVRDSYDVVADEYAAHLYDELEHKPLDREWLTRFAAEVGQPGPVCDLGCGPGQVARYLWEHGANVLGVDLSPRMVEIARELNKEIEFRVGDMSRLDVEDESWVGIVAFYAIVHIPRERIEVVFREMWRVLRPGGELLLSFHVGDEVRHLDEFFERKVSLDFIFFQRAWIEECLRAVGFRIVESVERDHYEGFEVETRRAYVWARKGA